MTDFLKITPYKLGSTFHENNIDIEHRRTLKNGVEIYSSYRYSEIYFFGKPFEAICYLRFIEDVLIWIEYRFHNKYFELFLNSINDELQESNKFIKDPFIAHKSYFTSFGDIAIGLDELTRDHFRFRYWLYKEFNKSVTIKK